MGAVRFWLLTCSHCNSHLQTRFQHNGIVRLGSAKKHKNAPPPIIQSTSPIPTAQIAKPSNYLLTSSRFPRPRKHNPSIQHLPTSPSRTQCAASNSATARAAACPSAKSRPASSSRSSRTCSSVRSTRSWRARRTSSVTRVWRRGRAGSARSWG